MIERKRGTGFMLVESGVQYDEDISPEDITRALSDGTLRAFEDPETGQLIATYQDWTDFRRELAARKLTAAFMSDVDKVLESKNLTLDVDLVHDISRQCAETAANRFVMDWMPVEV